MSRRQTVLIIDDERKTARLVAARLKPLGVEVLYADSGEGGLVLARQKLPDLILLDVKMPEITGFEVCRMLKAEPETHDIPVIFITGLEESINKVRGFDLGAVDYVTKPFDAAELRVRVRAALNTKSLMDMLTTQAQVDGLTGLRNRRYFDDRLEEEVKKAKRYARNMALMLLDVDRFKHINDKHGHLMGDLVLQGLADRIRQHARASDIACRYGGDEFAVILPETNAEAALAIATRLVEVVRIGESFGHLFDDPITVSIGLTGSPEPLGEAEDMVWRADRALYLVKDSGRDGVASYRDGHPDLQAA